MKRILNEKLPISSFSPIKARHYDYNCFTYPWHFHSQYEIMYVKQGTGQCFVGDAIHRYSGGDLILFGTNLPHYMNSDDVYKVNNESLRVTGTIIQFEKDFMSYSIDNYPQFAHIKILLEEAARGLHFPKEGSCHIIRLLEEIPGMEGVPQVTSLLTLLQEMATCKDKTILASPHFYDSFPEQAGNRLEKIISFINGNYTRTISLQEIASQAAMNRSAFCRYFREQTGKTFMEYVMEMRIGYACKLLAIEEKNIYSISMECGFDSITHFNRIFKRSMNCTPTQYQKKILK
jgi:AraC-like DNA-binding protein